MFIGKIYDKAKPNKKPDDGNNEEMDNRDHDSKKDWSKQRKQTIKKRNTVDSLDDDTVDIDKTERKKSKKETNNDKSFVERINEKVKSFKKSESSQIKNTKTIQSVYSIPLESNDVEKGVTYNNINNTTDKFENVDLNSEDSIKEYYTNDNKKNVHKMNLSSDKSSPGNISVGIQASPYPPFRLHVLPPDDWRDTETLCLKLVKLVVCQCGLACIVLLWALFGALMFHLAEAPHEYWQVSITEEHLLTV